MDKRDELVAAFEGRYGTVPSLVVRAPGRVNLIGEHTDYSLLPVLPMAIDRAVYIAVAPGPLGLEVDSLDIPNPTHLPVGADVTDLTDWHRYVAAALETVGFSSGARMLIGSDLPSTGGLSSSAALTVGVLAALAASEGDLPDPERLPDLALDAEHSIGVESGAMDQTIISLAQEGEALRIDFAPLRTRGVPISDAMRVVVGYSGSPAPKGGDANHAYNSRVVAARAAAVILADRLHVDPGSPPVLGNVSEATDLDVVPASASAREVATSVGIDVDQLVALTAKRFDPEEPLPVRSVAHHVLTEARRVDDAETALQEGRFAEFGELLDASHASLRDFGASSAGLDELTTAMREAGAWGSRLTGAGFGGYALAVCPADRSAEVVATAERTTGGPAFEVKASAGVAVV